MILTVDVGTSSARAALHDESGRGLDGSFHHVAYRPDTTPDGGMAHDAGRVLDAVTACIDAVLARPRMPDVAAVAVTTFWHGLLGFDAAGHAVTPIYMWGDTRSAREAALLRGALDEAAIHTRTGCPLHSSYWPAKLRWLARENPVGARSVARWGSFGEHLELSLFGEAATTISIASATGLFDQEALRWDAEALVAAELEAGRLFPLCDRHQPRRDLRSAWARRWPALRGVPFFPAVGDGAAGNVGSGCIDTTRIALNLGTSAALRVATTTPGAPPRGLWRYRLDRRISLIGGALSEGGNVLAWCRDALRLPPAGEVDAALSAVVADDHGLTVLPFLAGERAPRWRDKRRAVFAGLSLDTTPAAITAAALEAVSIRIALVYELLRPLVTADHTVIASGGALKGSRVWAQMITDALGRPVIVAREEEATSGGAARLALEALGRLPSLATAEPAAGDTLRPNEARHARYRAARERQAALDRAVDAWIEDPHGRRSMI